MKGRIKTKNFDELIIQRYLDLCEEKDFIPTQLYKGGKIPKSTLCAFINGSFKNISIGTLRKLFDSLDISVCEFFNHDYFK